MKKRKTKVKDKLTRTNKGITLIALVITIIVLLILAGVSIAMLTGQNGILTQAQNAKNRTEEAQEDELRKLTALEAATNLSNTTYKDKNEQIVTIPAGFAVSKIEGENTVEDGLVIIDSKGNEFVWIPVASESLYIRNINYKYLTVSTTSYTDEGYLPYGIEPTIANNITDEKQIGELNEQAEREAVVEAGGFYISRYEAGKEINGNNTNTLVSKKGASVWNDISQEDCKSTAKKFVDNDNIKSALCSGIQWDMTMSFIDKKIDGKGNVFNVEEVNTNRHSKKLAESGQNEFDKVCNIYDLEGNCYEYVAERNTYYNYNDNTFVDRGGNYKDESNLASFRISINGSNYDDVSFRFVLYLM